MDISYYLNGTPLESVLALDIVIGSGDIVSIDELPEDPQELVAFLQGESCGVKYWKLVVQSYVRAGKYKDGLRIATLGLAVDFLLTTDKESLHAIMGWTHLKMASDGQDRVASVDNAAREFDQAGAHPDVLLAKAQVHLYRDEVEPALRIYDELLKADANDCWALLGRAQVILRKTSNYASALKIYQQVLVINPAMKPDPRIGVGICFWFLKDRAMAIRAWNRAVELDPSNAKARLLANLASFDSVFLNSLSDDLFVAGYKSALQELMRLLAARPSDNSVLLALCSFYFSKGRHDLVDRVVAKVTASLSETASEKEAARKLSGYGAQVYSYASYWLGRVAYVKGDYTQAQKLFHEAIRLNDNNLLAKVGLGQSQLSRDSVEEAILSFESVLKAHPKCLEVIYLLGMLYSQSSSNTKKEQAINMLERYIRLSNNRSSVVTNKQEEDALLNKEPVALNAYLTLSKLYESLDLVQALTYLHKAIESRQQIKQAVPLEVYNNVAVFNFSKNNVDEAMKYLDLAISGVDDANIAPELLADLKVTLSFNLARTTEARDPEKAVPMYEHVLQECPGYVSAKLRLLFFDAVSSHKTNKAEIEQELKTLLSENASDMEIRSFYGWYIKTFGKRIGLKTDAESNHQKETLVDYNSHDSYALISLANIYCAMARDLKGAKEDEKRRKYFIRAIELYTKALSIDPKNVFAAQGLGIVYIENKEQAKGLEILRKVRDSLNDISVYLNLGHVLTDVKQFSKAIESYEIALARFTDNQDFKIIGFLGRAWYLRGLAEKNLAYLKKAFEYAEQALAKTTGVKSPFRFNVSFLLFQIADFITTLPVEKRSVDDINDVIINLNEGIRVLNELALEDEEHPPFPKSELKARADLGETTLLNRLTACLEETKQSVIRLEEKLDEAKRLREEAEMKKAQEQEKLLAERRSREEQMALERAKLQEQATQWAEESRADIVANSSNDYAAENGDQKPKKSNSSKKGRGKSKSKKKGVINDTDEEASAVETDPELGSDGEDKAAGKKRGKNKVAKRKRRAIEDENADAVDEKLEAANKKRRGSKAGKAGSKAGFKTKESKAEETKADETKAEETESAEPSEPPADGMDNEENGLF